MEKHLKKIINEMTISEKEYFSKFAKSFKENSETNSYILFDELNKKGFISNQFVNNNLKDKASLKYISLEKKRLLDKILLSLINYNFNTTYSWKIQKDILTIKILIQKGICNKAINDLKKIKKYAYRYEEFDALLSIILIEESLCFNNCFIINYEKLKKLKEERNKIFKIIDNLNYLLTIKAELQLYQFNEDTYNFDLNQFIKEYKHTPLIPENEVLSIKAKSIWLYIQSLYYFIEQDNSTALIYHTKHYELYKKYPEFFARNEVLQLINNFLYCCSLTKNENLFNNLMTEFLNIKNQTNEEKSYIKRTKYYRTLELYHQLEKYNEAEILANEAEHFLKNINYLDNTYLVKYIQSLIIRAYIENKNFNAAILISQIRYKSTGYELNSSMFKLFEFIAHYKLDNYEYLLYSINSWVKTIHSKRKQFPIEKVLIKFFRSVCNKTSIKEKKQLIINTINQLKDFEKSEQKYYINHFFDFAAWFERELEEINTNC